MTGRALAWCGALAVAGFVVPGFGAPSLVAGRGADSVLWRDAALPVASTESTLACFESPVLVPAINPGCFVTFAPPQPGDCSTQANQYLLQVLRPSLEFARRLRGFGFRSNDGDTVFPAAGAFLAASDAPLALPGPTQLATLQAASIASSADTSWVFVDLESADLVVPAGPDTVVLLVLGFPASGRLVAIGDGPGICVDAELPDADCDFFTIDAGVTWYAPAYDANDPLSTPLDWGFVLYWGPRTSVTARSWGQVKSLYRSP